MLTSDPDVREAGWKLWDKYQLQKGHEPHKTETQWVIWWLWMIAKLLFALMKHQGMTIVERAEEDDDVQ